ncbi:hypothetical protein AMTR_s00025p00217630 [Amborella trichopoda]|uniref:AMP-dependent synthetase/ligase domain-containing protein n=1 Tax=Amborella trichopoda TaxID=13333 RepID=W1PWN3_AMBTC|nr:hypothetical protein AMTR_s00025p00217630 [Amborella trichopoda]
MANNITLLHREKQHLEPLERDNGGEHIFTSKFPAVPVPYLTLPEFVLENWEKYEEKVAIVEAIGGKEFTYRQVVDGVRDFGNGLKGMGMVKGSVVIVLLPNIAEYPIIALGVMSAGGVFSGSNPLAHPSEVRKQVEDSGAKLIVTNGPCYEKVRDLGIPVLIVGGDPIENTIPWEELLKRGRNNDHFALKGDLLSENDQFAPTSKGSDENIHFTPDHATGWKNDHFTPKQGEVVCQDDLCALPYSSGTTGTSKGVMLTHRNLVANMCSTLFGVTPEMIGEFTTLGLMPFFHIYGITGICCATLRNKGKVVVMSRFELRLFLDALITHGVNFAPIVPPIMLSLVKNPIVDEFDLSRLKLRSVMTAAAPLAPDLLQVFEQKFPGVQVQEVSACVLE